MRGKSHLVCGIATSLTVSAIEFAVIKEFSLLQCAAMSIACCINSVLPDIDLENSIAGSKIKPVSGFINRVWGHRTITHSGLWLILWILLAVNTVNNPILFAASAGAGIGFFSHIISDTFTRGGVPWLYPFSKKRIHLTNINSGEHDWVFVLATTSLITFAVYEASQWLL